MKKVLLGLGMLVSGVSYSQIDTTQLKIEIIHLQTKSKIIQGIKDQEQIKLEQSTNKLNSLYKLKNKYFDITNDINYTVSDSIISVLHRGQKQKSMISSCDVLLYEYKNKIEDKEKLLMVIRDNCDITNIKRD